MEYLTTQKSDVPIDDDLVTSEEVKLNIIINSVTSCYDVGCKIDLNLLPERYIKKSKAGHIATMKVSDCSIVIKRSGKLLSMGASSEDQALSAAKKSIEILKSWGINATFNNYKILTIFTTCYLPWKIHLEAMAAKYHDDFIYESFFCELKMEKNRGFLGVYAPGSVRIVGYSVEMILDMLERALPYISEFRISV